VYEYLCLYCISKKIKLMHWLRSLMAIRPARKYSLSVYERSLSRNKQLNPTIGMQKGLRRQVIGKKKNRQGWEYLDRKKLNRRIRDVDRHHIYCVVLHHAIGFVLDGDKVDR
jgi:hypothetical protein